jgi:hypothetical protein
MVATIEYIEQIIETFQKAHQANANTEARLGNVVELKSSLADEVMVTADLHGHRQNFNAIRKIADLANHPQRHLVIQEVCHGGPKYSISGGCMSHMMLEDVAKLKVDFPQQVHFLMSNHEWAELTDYPILKNQQILNLLFRFGMQEMYGPATDKVREAYLPFLRTLPLAIRVEQGIWISHTLPENVDRDGFDQTLLDVELSEADIAENGPLFQYVWGRDFRQANADAFAATVDAEVLIHGHEPAEEGYDVPNSRQVILDSHADNGTYVMLPVGERLSQDDVVKRIKKLQLEARAR